MMILLRPSCSPASLKRNMEFKCSSPLPSKSKIADKFFTEIEKREPDPLQNPEYPRRTVIKDKQTREHFLSVKIHETSPWKDYKMCLQCPRPHIKVFCDGTLKVDILHPCETHGKTQCSMEELRYIRDMISVEEGTM